MMRWFRAFLPKEERFFDLFDRHAKGMTLTHQGHQFLRHVERCAAIVHVTDCATLEPRRDPISDFEVIEKELKVADATAISLCMDNRMPIVVFNLLRDGNIARATAGERIGTLISQPA